VTGPRWLLATWIAWGGCLGVTAGCGRTALGLGGPPGAEMDAGIRDGGVPGDGGGNGDAGADAAVDGCVPVAETCNGRDDDCDGVADDGVPCFFLDGVRFDAEATVGCGAAWYSYDDPDGLSANPDPDIRRADEVVLAWNTGADCAGAHLAMIVDVPGGPSPGSLQASFEIDPPLAGGIVVSDEPGECVYDPTIGRGACAWTWQTCCNDGVLLGAFVRDTCITVDFGFASTVTGVRVRDGSTGGRRFDLDETIELCVETVPAAP